MKQKAKPSQDRDQWLAKWCQTHLCNRTAAERVAFADHLGQFGQAYPPSSPLPFLCRPWVRDLCQALSPQIASALEQVAAEYFSDAAYRDQIPIPSHLHRVMRTFRGDKSHPVIRVDAFLDDQTRCLQILEFNTADPSAFAWNDWMLEGIQRTSQDNGSHGFSCDWIMPSYIRYLQRSYRTYCERHALTPVALPKIGIVISKESTVYFDFCSLRHLLDRYGFATVLGSPDEVGRRGADVIVGGESIDLMIRDTLDEIYDPDHAFVVEPMATILEQDEICVVNPVASTLGDQKLLLPVLQARLRNTAWCQQVGIDGDKVAGHLLETKTLTADTLAITASEPEHWVAKPSFGYGGHGVLLGRDQSQDWEPKLQRILADGTPYILQRYCQAGVGEYWDEQNQILIQDLHANYSFWIIDGEFAGAFVRLSKDRVINTHQGGALVPVFYGPN